MSDTSLLSEKALSVINYMIDNGNHGFTVAAMADELKDDPSSPFYGAEKPMRSVLGTVNGLVRRGIAERFEEDGNKYIKLDMNEIDKYISSEE
jgi:hypothetical protein